MQPTQPRTLPELRPELRLLPGSPSVYGAPSWLIHDPVQNRFIQIDAAAYEVLSRWDASSTADDLARRVAAAGRVETDADAVASLADFLHSNRLTIEPPRDGWRYYAAERQRSRHSPAAWLVHNYLFFRIPLVRPQRFLERTLTVADALSSRVAVAVIAALGLAGLYLAMRQWELFLATLPDYFTFEGIVLMGITLMLVKAAHELGHAYTAVRYGCRVPTMGIAFMMMAPLLYTDVTDAWRLRDRRQRLRIDSAGVRVELAVAAVALFLWSFLPDGALRGLAFSLAVVSTAATLLINLNPLMRFDGYYLLSEMLGIENLQARAFEVGCWKLRELLFGLGAPCPEHLPRRTIAALVAYAWATWIYRLLLFVGIALIVYQYFFKVLGIILFLVEIVYFVARPIWNELMVWFKLKDRIVKSRRAVLTAGAASALLLLAVVPWSSRVDIPAVVEFERMQPLHATRGARVAHIHVRQGERIAAGAPVATLASPDLEHELASSETSLRLARLQYARRGADASDREASLVIEDRIRALESKIAGLQRERAELVVRAPFAGAVVDLNEHLHPGRWLGPKEMIALVGDVSSQIVKGYVGEGDLWRLGDGAAGSFVPESIQRAAIPVAVAAIAVGGAPAIDIPELISTNAGRIAVTTDKKGRQVPATAQYLVRMNVPAGTGGAELSVRGLAHVEGLPESFVSRLWRQTLKVIMREGGA